MEPLLNTLCGLLDDELERQETVLAVCIAQGHAARVHDMEYLEAKTAALNILMQEFVEAERDRQSALEAVCSVIGVSSGGQCLSRLIPMLPEPWQSRLTHFQTRMRNTLAETRQVVLANNAHITRSMKVVDRVMEALVRCIPAPTAGYNAQGTGPASLEMAASFIDQRG